LLATGLVTGAHAQESPVFTPGNLVVAVEGCGVEGGTCTNIPGGSGGNGTVANGNYPLGGYGDNQAAPITLFQFQPSGTSSVSYVNSMALPPTASAANSAISGELGSTSEGTLQLSGDGKYLTVMGYGINSATFNTNSTAYILNPANAGQLGQSGSVTNQTAYTPVPRVVALIDANGNVNTSTVLYNIFNANNPRSAYTANGSSVYVSGQGTKNDTTAGVFYSPVGEVNNAPTPISGNFCINTSLPPGPFTESEETRTVQIYNNTLYVSMDSTENSSCHHSYIGTLGDPPATSLFTYTYTSGGTTYTFEGPDALAGIGNSTNPTSATGKLTITAGAAPASTNGNTLNNTTTKVNGAALNAINLSPENYFFASSTVLYVADSGFPKNDSNGDNNSTSSANIGDGGLQKWIYSGSTWTLAYTLYQGLNLVNNGSSAGTTGLYGLAGTVSGSNVYLYATNMVINDWDQGYLYGITDNLTYTTPSQAASETFTQLAQAPSDSSFKGVSFAPSIPAGDVEVTTVPSGLAFSSSGTGCAPGSYVAPFTLDWTASSSCTLSVTSPQAGPSGVQYMFTHWQDGTTSTSDLVTAPSTTATYTATFTTGYQLNVTAGSGGSITAPATSSGYYATGSQQTLTAVPSAGHYFTGWTGSSDIAIPSSASTTITMNGPETITANFAAQVTPLVTWPTANPITYGQTLASTYPLIGGSATLSDGVTPVAGSFAFTYPGTIPAAGTSSQYVTFTPSSAEYATVSGTISVTVNAAAPVLPPTQTGSSTYGTSVTLSVTIGSTGSGESPTGSVQFQFVDSVNSVTYNICSDGTLQAQTPTPTTPCVVTLVAPQTPNGTATATVTTANLPAGLTPDAITATYNPADSNYTGGTTTINYTVNMASTTATLAITSSTTTPPTYGDPVTLSSTVSDSTTNSTGTPTGTVQFQFSSAGTTYNICSDGTVQTQPAGTPCAVTLDGNGNAQTLTTGLAAGSPAVSAIYSGDANFTGTSSGTSAYPVIQKSLTVTGITANSKPYDGTTAATLNLSGASLVGVVGTDVVNLLTGTATGTFASAGAGGPITVNITGLTLGGAAAGNYTLPNPAATTTANITPVQLTVTAPSPTVTYGDPVPTLTSNITGFVNDEGTGVLTTQPACITTYTPTSNAGSAQTTSCSGGAAANYTFAYVAGTVTVNQASATINVTPYSVTYNGNQHTATDTDTGVGGVSLSSTDFNLSGTTHTTAGTYSSDSWSFTDPAGNYKSANGTVIDTIGQATATITVTPYSVTYDGNPHTATGTATGVGGVSLSSTDFNLTGTTHITAGIYSADPWSFSDPNYKSASGAVGDTIGQVTTKVITWPTASGITYGQTLSSSKLIGGSASPSGGTFAFTTPGLAPPTGTVAQSVTYTPVDPTDYTIVTGTVNVTVSKATPTVSFTGAPASAPYHATFTVTATTNASSTPSMKASGSCTISGTIVTISAGSGTCSLTAAWVADSNYLAATATQSTTATKATPQITWPTPAPIAYGTALSGTQLDAKASNNGATVAGTFAYTPAAGTVLNASSSPQPLSVVFTPTSTADYYTASDTVSLQVNQATPKITWTKPATITYGTAVSSTELDATSLVPGTFVYTPAVGTVLTAGTGQTLSVTFTPALADATNYTTATDSTTINVNQASTTTTITSVTPNPATENEAVAIDFTVTGAGSGPTGIVTVTGTGGLTCTGTLTAGAGSCPLTFTTTGTKTLTAAYSGDTNYKTSTSAKVSMTVHK
jgi:hypothetical protein